MKTRRIVSMTALALGFAGLAHAAVSFSPESGTGFVGKGDVQLAFGWNNEGLQSAAAQLEFSYSDQATYDVPCEKDAAKKTMEATFKRKKSIDASVVYDTRKNKQGQVTGFNLVGFGATDSSDNVECPAGWRADGEPVLVSATGGQLEVGYGDASHAIWSQPVGEE